MTIEGPSEDSHPSDDPIHDSDKKSALSALDACLLHLEQQSTQNPAAETVKLTGQTADPALPAGAGDSSFFSIGRFQIERELGRGGCGVVFLAFDPQLNRRIALKIPRLDTVNLPELKSGLLREAKAAAALDHPNIVPIYEVGEHGSFCYVALAYCDGPDLDRWFSSHDRTVPPDEAASIAARLAAAIEHGHQRGILHCDLKPANIMMVPRNEAGSAENDGLAFAPRITDFGMAKVADAALTHSRSSIVMGTPLYMAPEQITARTGLTPAVDVYSLGVILYELLTGQPPFRDEPIVHLLDRLRSDELPESPRKIRPEIPLNLERICLKCLEKAPKDRYASAAELLADLERFLRGEPVRARELSGWSRLGNWVRKRRRIRDAGLLVIFLNSIIAVWSLLNPVLISSGVMSADFDRLGLWRDSVMISAVHVLCIWLGVGMLKERRLAIWSATFLAAALFVLALLIPMGFGKPFGGAYENRLAAEVVFNMICVMLGVELAACVIATIAERQPEHQA